MKITGADRGFTLVELIVVVVIGVLAAIAAPFYNEFSEKARAAEAVTMLTAIRDAEIRYYTVKGFFTLNDKELDTQMVDSSTWMYLLGTTGYPQIGIQALRIGYPPGPNGISNIITLSYDNETKQTTWLGEHPGVPKN